MGCGCGGSGNGGGGCAGGASQVVVPEPAQAGVQAFEPVVEQAPAADDESEDEPSLELIASSEQEWPRIKVNGVAIAPVQVQDVVDKASRQEGLAGPCAAIQKEHALGARMHKLAECSVCILLIGRQFAHRSPTRVWPCCAHVSCSFF